jgi:squalene synthase HpnC
MTLQSDSWRTGKSHRDENFPVASWLIHPRHRKIILAFYDFVRCADDVADHATLGEREKLDLLDRLEQGLYGKHDESREANALRSALRERNMSPEHALDLLTAFRLDVTKGRYRDWDDLIDYCRYSAMPVGRFVLDVHGEDRATWVASDALCAALQIINHLQDCGKDFRNLDRVYVPCDALEAAGAEVQELTRDAASPALRKCLVGLAERTGDLLAESDPLPGQVADFRLSIEISVIQALARRLVEFLITRDPLSQRVHLKQAGFAVAGLAGVAAATSRRMTRSLMTANSR